MRNEKLTREEIIIEEVGKLPLSINDVAKEIDEILILTKKVLAA